jgi:hypothetical protein
MVLWIVVKSRTLQEFHRRTDVENDTDSGLPPRRRTTAGPEHDVLFCITSDTQRVIARMPGCV